MGDQAIAAIYAGRAIGSARERSPTEPGSWLPRHFPNHQVRRWLARPALWLLLRADDQEKQRTDLVAAGATNEK